MKFGKLALAAATLFAVCPTALCAFYEYTTEVNIYLDPVPTSLAHHASGGTTAYDTRWDLSGAVSTPTCEHRRDFIFSCGWYNDITAPPPATGTANAWVCSASNNSVGWPKNPARSPVSIFDAGWYTFRHSFENSAGKLVVKMTILKLNGQLMNSWTLADPSDIIDDTVGGNRYGWFVVVGCTSVQSGSCSTWDTGFKLPIDDTKKCSDLGCDFEQGFEDNTDGWFENLGKLQRVASGKDGVSSSLGLHHAEVIAQSAAFTRWGGYCKSLNPTAVCINKSVPADSNCHATVNSADVGAGSTDPNNLELTYSLVPPGPYALGATPVTLTVTNTGGLTATCTATITVVDMEPPNIDCPATMGQNNDPEVCGATVTYTAPVGTDNCPAPTTMTAGLTSGAFFPVGTTRVKYEVTDATGARAECSFDVTVVDKQAPTINCPPTVIQSNDPGVCGATVTYTAPVGTDNCPAPTTTITEGLASGAFFPVGNTVVNYRVMDVAGNTAECSFSVKVEDNEMPSLPSGCPANQRLPAAAPDCQANMPDWKDKVTDNCGIASFTQDPALNTPLSLGDHDVTLTAIDVNGNNFGLICDDVVTVVDDEPPSIECGIESPYDQEWHFHPCDASGARPLQFKATATKENECLAEITDTTDLLCERCNGANKVLSLPCNGITTVGKDTLQIANTNGVGTFISWKVKAGVIEENCGICIETPNNNDGEGCLAGKTGHRNLRSDSVFVKADNANKPFECPNEYPQDGEDSWPGTSLSDLGCAILATP